MALTFKEAFGPTAELYRTNDIGNMFAVRSEPVKYGNVLDSGGESTSIQMTNSPSTWKFDANTGKFTNSADPTKTVNASDLGFGGIAGQNVPYALTKLANDSGALKDPWAKYAIDHHPEWGVDQIIGGLRNDAQKITQYDSNGSQGVLGKVWDGVGTIMDKYGLPITMAVATAGSGLFGPSGVEGGGFPGTEVAAPVTDATMAKVGADGLASQSLIDGGVSSFGASADAAANSLAANSAIDPTIAQVMAGTGKSAADAARLVAIAQSSTSGGADAVRATLTSMGVPAGVVDTLVKLAPAAAGALIASSGGGGAKQAGTTTATETRAPWSPVQPYLTDIASKAQANYNAASTMSPQQQGLLSQAQSIASGQMNDPRMAGLRDQATSTFMGTNPAFSPVQNIAGPNTINAQQVDPNQWMSAGAPTIDPSRAFNSLGRNDPSNAYGSLLTGNVTNPYLSNIAHDNFTMANRNLLENVMPNIRSGAQAAGQYGGSRQGIAEGLATSRMNQDVTAANNQMFGNAYQQAQGNMLSAAGQLGGFGMSAATSNASNVLNNNQFNSNLGVTTATNNANRALAADTTNASNQMGTQQFNANLGLTNNTQRLGQMNAGVDWFNNANNMQNTAIKNSLDLGNYGNTYANDALKNYAGIVSPLGGLGQTGSSSTPYYTNPTNNLLGGAIAGAQIFKNIFS